MCALEFPGIESDIWQLYKDTGSVQVLAVNADTMGNDNVATVQQFVDQTQITFPAGLELSSSYSPLRAAVESISPYPLDVVIDQNGDIAYLSGEYDPNALTAIVNTLIQ